MTLILIAIVASAIISGHSVAVYLRGYGVTVFGMSV
jgi:hypothetical protein